MATFTTASELEIRNNLAENIKNTLNTTYTASDSTSNIIANSVASSIGDLKNEVVQALNQMQLSQATGESLDAIGFGLYGLRRKQATKANTRNEGRNLVFTAGQKTFGELNNANPIIIPKGTSISVIDDFDTRDILYTVIEDTTLGANLTTVAVKVEAVATGEFYNVERDTLIFHNFRNYARSQFNELSVTNLYPIVNGADLESDELYRNRIINHVSSMTTNSNNYYLYRGLSIPGVVDVRVIPSYYGIGTVGVLPITDGSAVSTNINNSVISAIGGLRVTGHTVEVVPGITVSINMNVNLNVDKGISALDKATLAGEIKRFIFRLIKTQEINNSRIDFSTIENALKNESFPYSTYTPSNDKVLSNIYISGNSSISGISGEAVQYFNANEFYSIDITETIVFGKIQISLNEVSR